jgi:hypothetical protein
MKKTLILLGLMVFSTTMIAQDKAQPNLTLKWAPTGLVLGSISLQGEYNFGKISSLTAKIGIPVNKNYQAVYDDNDADISMKAFSFLAGYRMYMSKKKLRGFYLEPYFKYVHHTSEGIGSGSLENSPVTMSFSNEYNGTGVGLQLGAQFIIKNRFVIDLFFLGPEINSASNRFKAVDISNSIGWTTVQANEAEQDIHDFLDQFPFVRNRVDVMVDKPNRTVKADFKGALPGIRTGFSIGIAL